MNQQSIWRRPQAVLLAATLVLGIGGVGVAVAQRLAPHAVLDLKVASADEPATHAGFAPVVKKVLPAVVSISSSKVTKVQSGMDDQQIPDLFRQFFGDQGDGQGEAPGNGQGNGQGNGRHYRQQQAPRTMREQALGSGVIMTPDGYILTNNHVVDGATSVKVTLSDRREFPAKIVGTDAKVDVAVLKIDAANLPVITVGDSAKAQVGDYALAIGNPFGVGETVTMGIVSATGRSNMGIEDYEDFIQTDAPINPGNSGGALVNDRGELVGINTAIIAHGSEGNQGIGFAVPANMAVSVMRQIVDHGKVDRAYLGIYPQDLTPAMAKAFGEKDMGGALVGDVTPNGPAASVGLQKGDIILQVNGKPVMDANGLRMTISMLPPQTTVSLKVFRDGASRDYTVKLGELPVEHASAEQPANGTEKSKALSGVSVENLDADTAHQLGLPANSAGVVVTNVDPASSAADAGLKPGDVIQSVNRKPVHNTSDFERALGSSKDNALLLVNRHGNTMFVAV